MINKRQNVTVHLLDSRWPVSSYYSVSPVFPSVRFERCSIHVRLIRDELEVVEEEKILKMKLVDLLKNALCYIL